MPNETQPQYGLPYQRLPGAQTSQGSLTPESMLNQEIQTGLKQIQSRFTLAWDEINNSRRFIGEAKASQMQQQLHAKAKQEVLQFNQQAQQQLTQLQNIDRLAQQGLINNPDEIKMRMYNPDVARSMFPTPEKEKPPMQQFADLDTYSHRISDELEWFKEDKSSKFPGYTKLLGPGGAGVLAAHYIKKAIAKRKVRIWDPATEDYTIKATPEKIAEYDMWLRAEKDVAAQKRELAGRPDISRRRAQPDVRSGFDAGVTESIRPRQTPKTTKPKVIKQRNTRTRQERISYDGGRTWQTMSG